MTLSFFTLAETQVHPIDLILWIFLVQQFQNCALWPNFWWVAEQSLQGW